MKKLMLLVVLAMLLTACTPETVLEATLDSKATSEEEYFKGCTMKTLSAEAEIIAIAEVKNITETQIADAEDGKWHCEFQLFYIELLECFRGECSGQSLSLPVVSRYRSEDCDIETAYWKAVYEGQRYTDGDKLLIFVSSADLLFGESREDFSDIIFICGNGDGFYSSGLMQRIAEPNANAEYLFSI